jgi:tRNA1Val (adenine37-N6)-methyltransferase
MDKPFKFKQFTVEQDRCAMKVGTDGILLGAWASIDHNPESILDIGAGTGLIALMLAQRSQAELIDAIEIDGDAYEQCVHNFENSLWGDRLFCYHASLQEFVTEIGDKYDLIVSNPPFHTTAIKSKSTKRNIARFENALPFDLLIKSAVHLLSPNGVLCLVVPHSEETHLLTYAKEEKLHPTKIIHVKGTPSSEIKRSLLEFSFQKQDSIFSELIIESKRHEYTEDFVKLTKDFYLNL